MTNSTRPARRSAGPPAEDLLARARAAGDIGRPAVAVRLCRRALQKLGNEPADEPLRVRVVVTMSFNLSELGRTGDAIDLIAAAETDGELTPTLLAAKGLVLYRAGRAAEAMAHMDRAIVGLGEDPSQDLATVLLNRGFQHMLTGNLIPAQRDTAEAERLGGLLGDTTLVFMARYNLGYIKFLAGDLPGALDAMATAEGLTPDAALGIPALDRARVLLAAGLVREAAEYCSSAIDTFTANRALGDLTDALLVRADIALMADDPTAARSLARAAARMSGRRRNVSAALLAQLAEQRASAVQRRALSSWPEPPTPRWRKRASADAHVSELLAARLAESGLRRDAASAALLAAEAHLDAGDSAAAVAAHEAADIRRIPLATRLQARLVGARIDFQQGRRAPGLAQLRRGLDDLADFQALFGSQDLQTAASLWGRELSREGLRAAVSSGSPGAILQWLERARATTTRLPHVRPPADPELAADLGALRVAQDAARVAVMSGHPDRDREREVEEIRRRIRARSWTLGGTGSALQPPTLASVRRALAVPSGGPDRAVVLAYFYGAGSVHLLRITSRSAGYFRLTDFDTFDAQCRRAAADLELLSSDRIPEGIRAVAGRSLAATLRQLSAGLIEPVLEPGAGPVLVSGTGPLAVVPWAMLPGLADRPVSVTHSVTASLSGFGRRAAGSGAVLAVAGPELNRAEEEAVAVAGHYPGAVALGGSAATGAAVLGAMPGRGVLHVAAHGHHEPENPLFSSVLLADGPLFAYDIAPLPALPDQIVLSSCDVGRVDMRADAEPLGLAVALLRSGVRTVVAAVAPVSDHAAAAVMDAYHRRLASGAGPAHALAESLAAAGDRPAPFTCFGAGE